MFKTFTFIVAFLLISSTSFSQIVKMGDAVPDYQFEKVLNYSKSTINLREAKGKILIIEFWGTWCGPCIPYLEHLNELQQKFKEEILVVGISDDTEERLNKFLLKRPVTIPLVADPMNKSAKYFQVKAFPQTFVADKNGEIIAITHPSEITEEKIKDLVVGKKVEIATHISISEPSIDYFNADPKTIFSFAIKPMIDSVRGNISKKGNDIFQDRRYSLINGTTDQFIREIFQRTYSRTLILVDKKQFEFKPENRFCFDIIVPEEDKADFYKIAQEEVKRRFKYKIYTEEKMVDVFVLKKIEGSTVLKPSQLEQNESFETGKRFRYSMQGCKMIKFTSFFEDTFNIPVIDETGLKDKYDLTVDWAMGNKEERTKELQNIGLTLEKTQRPVEMLVIADK
jgi:peroxiredoxin